ncbi:MAG TPA: hypothetical protein VN973_05990 [Candidatus Dormibacteraeota bacterium]|nr:hypothetical protein [Candidatus Dormibacteraeota bacterium]
MAEQRAAVANQRTAVKTHQVMAAAQRKLDRTDRMLQARMEKLVRTRLRDQMIRDRRAGLTVDPKKYMRTSTEISAEATALIKETFAHVEEGSDGRGRRLGESMADWLTRVKD